MKRYLLPTIVSLVACNYVLAQEQAVTEVTTPEIIPQVQTPEIIPAPVMSHQEMIEKQKNLMAQERAEMLKQIEQQRTLMEKEIAQQKALIEKQIAQQKTDMEKTRESIQQIRKAQNPEERRRLMDEMHQRQQEKRDEMWKKSGMMQRPYDAQEKREEMWKPSGMMQRPYNMYPRGMNSQRTWGAPVPQYAPRNQYRMPRYLPMQEHRTQMETRLENIENLLKKLVESIKEN